MNDAGLDSIVQRTLEENKMVYEVFPCDPELADTVAFCEHYGFSPEDSANTIVVASRKIEPTKYAVCVVLAAARLDVNKKVSELLGAKRVSFADAEVTKKLTGMMLGGVTAIGAHGLPIYVDSAVMQREKIIMGGGNRSSKVLLNPKELLKLAEVQVIKDLAKPTE